MLETILMTLNKFSNKQKTMFNKLILFIAGIFLLAACGETIELETPAKEQIIEYSKKLEDYKEEKEEQEKKPLEEQKQIKHVRNLTIQPDDIVYGDPEAKTVLIEYFSPTCRHCVSYHKKTFPQIQKHYINTGKIAYVMREFIGNKQDLDATVLARCSGGIENYTKFINVILDQQNNWAFNKKFREILTNIGTLGGVSAEQYAMCLQDDDLLNTLIENTKVVVKEPRFIGTPSFFINGKQFTKPYTFEELSNAINEAMIANESEET